MLGIGTNFKLKLYLSEKIFIQLISDQKVSGILRGFDQFLNIVIDDAYIIDKKEKQFIGTTLIRGDMIISLGKF
jgi:small nuclear ribonucleoprotein G